MELHKLQVKVLRELSRNPSLRFSDMMAVTDLTSDDFKFHLRKLVTLGLAMKNENGTYELTASGKELANRFDDETRQPIRQPKLTTVVYLKRMNSDTGETEYLFQQRLRQPFFGYWGVVGEPIRWGESFEEAAARGLEEQTGLSASLTFKGFYRQRDIEKDSKVILEDKLFVVFVAKSTGDEIEEWPYAVNKWMSAKEISEEPKRFDSCLEMLDIVEGDKVQFSDNATVYVPEDY